MCNFDWAFGPLPDDRDATLPSLSGSVPTYPTVRVSGVDRSVTGSGTYSLIVWLTVRPHSFPSL